MKICFVNTHDIIGGAERCSYDLLTGLRRRGHGVSLVVGRKLSDDPDVYPCSYPRWDWMPRSMLHHYLGITDTTLITPHRMVRNHAAFRTADVVNIHNMHGCYWSFWTLPVLARRGPVVLTLHDEWFLTGDCVYTYDCAAWQRSCGKCPQMKQPFRPNLGGRDATSFNLRLKRWAAGWVPTDRLVIVTPSEWLLGQIRRSHLGRFRAELIPYGVDTFELSPRDKLRSKVHFGLPRDRFCFLVFANNLDDPRKGADLVVRTVARYGLPENAVLLVVGNGGDQLAARIRAQQVPVHSRPYIRDRQEISECLSAADCLLLLSAADNLPYAGIEAVSCGCPVLARDVGGIPEIVREGESGSMLPANASEEDVFAGMQRMARLTLAEQGCIGERTRQFATQHFAMSRFLTAYESLFEELVEENQSRARGGKPKRKESMAHDDFEEQIVKFALDPANHDRFSHVLTRILPEYAAWSWGRDSPFRRHFNEWQQAGFTLMPTHYYSPVPDAGRLRPQDFGRISDLPGISMQPASQMDFLNKCAPFQAEYAQFPAAATECASKFHFNNGTFESPDAEVLHVMVRQLQPRRIIEIGSGYTTLVSAAACESNRIENGVACEFVAIEPYPNALFRNPIPGLTRLIDSRLEDIDLEMFSRLGENDILFIDSSHVMKLGSDVYLEYLEILPRLKPGVFVHIHDIFLPAEYPKRWITDEHVFWNEQYVLQAFLAFNSAFHVVWAGSYMHRHHPGSLAEAFPSYNPQRSLPGSFWMRKVD